MCRRVIRQKMVSPESCQSIRVLPRNIVLRRDGKLFDLETSGDFYTRLQNPTNDAVAARLCALEGGAAAMLTSSGQAANFFAVFNICQVGDHLISSSASYGGTLNLFAITMKKMGIDVTFLSRLFGRRAGCRFSGEYQMCLWRNALQSFPCCVGYREICQRGAPPWRSPDCR